MSKNILEDITILVVDNEDKSREELREVFQTAGYNCLSASNGKEALQLLEENDVDLVVTDTVMPKFDGVKLAENIRDKYDSRVIMMDSPGGDFTHKDAQAAGASDFVQKPLDIRELLELVSRLLHKRS